MPAPAGLADAVYTTIREQLDDTRFHTALRQAIREVFRQYPALGPARFRVSR